MGMSFYKFGRGEGEPEGEGDAGVVVAFEHFEEGEFGVAGIFDVVAHGFGDVGDVASIEVHGSSIALSGEEGESSLAFDEVEPFIGVGVPVHFAEAAGVEFDEGCGYGLGNGEVGRVDDAGLAAGG